MRLGNGGRVYAQTNDVGLIILLAQERLHQLTSWVADNPGVFSTAMTRCLKRWQASNRLPETGHLDSNTWYALFGVSDPPLKARALSAASWMLGMGPSSRLTDGPLGPRWGQWGMSFRSFSLQQSMKVLRTQTPEIIAGVLTLERASSQIAWFLLRTRERQSLSFLPPGHSPEERSLQAARAKALCKGLPDSVDLIQEVDFTREILLRVLLDTANPNDIDTWRIGDVDRLKEQAEHIRTSSEILTRRGALDLIDGTGRSFERFGLG